MYFSQRFANDKPVTILGDGPSLNRDDIEFANGKASILAINYSIRLAPFADAWYYHHEEASDEMMGDVDVLGAFMSGAMTVYSSAFNAKYAGRPWPVVKFSGQQGLELDPRLGIRTNGSSGGAAINLAYHMGARKIILLGFDCCEAPDGTFNWWKPQKDPTRLKYNYEDWKRKFAAMAPALQDAGVRVVNASRRTDLDAFPTMPLSEALRTMESTHTGGRGLENH